MIIRAPTVPGLRAVTSAFSASGRSPVVSDQRVTNPPSQTMTRVTFCAARFRIASVRSPSPSSAASTPLAWLRASATAVRSRWVSRLERVKLYAAAARNTASSSDPSENINSTRVRRPNRAGRAAEAAVYQRCTRDARGASDSSSVTTAGGIRARGP